MININLKLEFPYDSFQYRETIPVYFKNRVNTIGTCTINKASEGTTGSLTLNDELHDGLFVFFLCSMQENHAVLEGLLLDDATLGTSAPTIGSIKSV
jgi:hypothetical protein